MKEHKGNNLKKWNQIYEKNDKGTIIKHILFLLVREIINKTYELENKLDEMKHKIILIGET